MRELTVTKAATVPTLTEIARAERDNLPAVIDEIDRSMQPCGVALASKAVTIVMGNFKIASDVVPNPDIYVVGMKDELARYPYDIVDEAIRVARRTFDWLPSIAQMVKLCESLMEDRKEAKRFALIQLNGIRSEGEYFWYLKRMKKARLQGAEIVFQAVQRGNTTVEPKRIENSRMKRVPLKERV